MGRITIFTEDDCQQSLLLREYLVENTVPFHDISLTKNPGRTCIQSNWSFHFIDSTESLTKVDFTASLI